MQVVQIGLDLAKYVFEVHGVDSHGKVLVRKTLRRDAVARFFANLPPCLVGMEAEPIATEIPLEHQRWRFSIRCRDNCEITGWPSRRR